MIVKFSLTLYFNLGDKNTKNSTQRSRKTLRWCSLLFGKYFKRITELSPRDYREAENSAIIGPTKIAP